MNASGSCLSRLECARCGRELPADRPPGPCPDCGGPLLARYDLEAAGRVFRPSDLAGRPTCLWRYREVLPVQDPAGIVTLGEGWTPLVRLDRLRERWGLAELFVKDEARLPAGSVKARAAAVGVSRARELGIRRLVLGAAGSAGGAWAAYSARAGLELTVFMSADAPPGRVGEAVLVGAKVILVEGGPDDAVRRARQAEPGPGQLDVSAFREPYQLEGAKTLGYELYEQLDWRPPNAVICPVGNGSVIVGIWKAVNEMEAMGWIPGRKPRLIGVQAAGCAPVVRAFDEGAEECRPWADAGTLAGELRVADPPAGFLALRAIRETGGWAAAVTDGEIREAMRLAASTEGLILGPEGAAALAALDRLARAGMVLPGNRLVVLNTGTGNLPGPAEARPVLRPAQVSPL